MSMQTAQRNVMLSGSAAFLLSSNVRICPNTNDVSLQYVLQHVFACTYALV